MIGGRGSGLGRRRGDGFGGWAGQDEHAAMGLVRGRNGGIGCRGEGGGRRGRGILSPGIVASFGIGGGEILVVDVIEIDGGILVGFCHPPPPIEHQCLKFERIWRKKKEGETRVL